MQDMPDNLNNLNKSQNQIQDNQQQEIKTVNPKKILIIEDDELLVKMYTTKFSMEKFIVDTALDGEEAIKKLQTSEYDIILLDLMLPKLDGFSVLQQLRASTWPNSKKPVIVLSNLGQQTDIDRAKQLGADDYLVKANLTPNQIVEKIRSI